MCDKEKIFIDADVLESAWRFADAVREIFDPVGVYLFGSHAKGTARPGSDIDLAVVVPSVEGLEENPLILFDISHKLWDVAYVTDDRIEPHFIDNSRDVSGFINTILATGIRLSESGDTFFPDEDPLR